MASRPARGGGTPDPPHTERHDSGTTLPEVMIASFIVVVATLVLVTGTVFSLMMMASARNHVAGETLAMDRLWILYNMDYDGLRNQQIVTEAVPTNHALHALGGTIRSAVEVYTNRCVVRVRVDWRHRSFGGDQLDAHQELRAERRDTRRGPT